MDNDDFYGGMVDDRDADKLRVDAAEHLVRLKKQSGLSADHNADLEKEAKIFGGAQPNHAAVFGKVPHERMSAGLGYNRQRAEEEPTWYGRAIGTGAAVGGGVGVLGGLAHGARTPGLLAATGLIGAGSGALVGGTMAHGDHQSIAKHKKLRQRLLERSQVKQAGSMTFGGVAGGVMSPNGPTGYGYDRDLERSKLTPEQEQKYHKLRAARRNKMLAGTALVGGGVLAHHLLTKKADFSPSSGLPEAIRGDATPRVIPHEAGPRVSWDGRKGYNYTGLQHEGRHHILVDHHASGRVGHIIINPETGAIEQSEVHPSHKHMGPQFQERAMLMRSHLPGLGHQAQQGQEQEKLASVVRRLRFRKHAAQLGSIVHPDPNQKPLLKKKDVKEIRSSIPSGGKSRLLEMALDKLQGKSEKTKTAGISEAISNRPLEVATALGAILGTGAMYANSRSGKKIPEDERGKAGFASKMKGHSDEFGRNVSKTMREHPLAGALAIGGPTGMVVGRQLAKALGAGK